MYRVSFSVVYRVDPEHVQFVDRSLAFTRWGAQSRTHGAMTPRSSVYVCVWGGG